MDWHPITRAPFDRDLELAVIEAGTIHPILFPCRRDRLGWVRADDGKGVGVHPTHWREGKRHRDKQ
jgi:hypothetical protein